MPDVASAARSSGSFLRGVAPGLQKFGQDLNRYEEENETSKLAAELAKAQTDLTLGWLETARNADPNDQETASNFMANMVAPRLDQIGEKLNTRAGRLMYERARAGLESDLRQKTTVDQAELAGVAEVQNAQTVANQVSTSLLADPTGFNTGMGMIDLYLEGATRIPMETRLKLGTQMRSDAAKATLLGVAEVDPTRARAEMASGKYDAYMDADAKVTIGNHLTALENAKTQDQRAAEAEARRVKKEHYDAKANELVTALVQPDGQIVVPEGWFQQAATDMVGAPDAGESRALINMGRSILDDEKNGSTRKSDPATFDDFRRRMYLPETDPNALDVTEIYEAVSNGKLSATDMNFLRTEVTGKRDPGVQTGKKQFEAFLAGYKSYITKSNPLSLQLDAPGDQRYYEFQQRAQELFDQGVSSGKSWQDLLHPSSKDFIGAIVPQYQMNTKQSVGMLPNFATGAMPPLAPVEGGPVAPQRLPNETAAAYLKRVGGQ